MIVPDNGLSGRSAKSDATRRRDSPLVTAIRTASRLKLSICSTISPVSLIACLILKWPAQNPCKSTLLKAA